MADSTPMMGEAFEGGGDLCLQMFHVAWQGGHVPFPPAGRVLEIGCAEADWLTPMHAARPDLELIGIDWRPCVRPGASLVLQGNVLDQEFGPASFDGIVLVSALEHIGLGHYARDPLDADGDTHTVDLITHWLKPTGVLYFDVPWNPDPGYRVNGTHERVYDDATLKRRLNRSRFQETWRGYTADGQTFVSRPETARDPFWYVAVCWTPQR